MATARTDALLLHEETNNNKTSAFFLDISLALLRKETDEDHVCSVISEQQIEHKNFILFVVEFRIQTTTTTTTTNE